MELQAVLISTDDGRKQIFLGYPLMEDDEEIFDIDEALFTDLFFVPDDTDIKEALTLLGAQLLPMLDQEELLH